MKPTVLLLSTTTGYQLRSFGGAAERAGVDLLLATDRCHHLDDPWRDAAVPVRFYDEEESLRSILAAPAAARLAGVVAVGDRPTVLAARVAETLRLPGNPPHAVEAARSKALMRERFAAAGLPVPWYRRVSVDTDPRTLRDQVAWPCVVKPLGLSGSRGVIRVDGPAQLEAAVARVRALLARPEVRAQRTGLTDDLLLEGYIAGHEYALEGLLSDGRLRVLAIFDKPDPLDGPFFEETIYVTPPLASDAVQRRIGQEVQRATRALGLVHGSVHAECRVGPEGVTMLEVAARPIGGLCSKVLRFAADGRDVSLEELLLRHAIGEDTSGASRERAAAGVMMIPIPKRGLFKGVAGTQAATSLPGVEEVIITAKADQLLEPLPEGDSYPGFIFVRGDVPSRVVETLRDAHRQLEFRIDPELRVIGRGA